MDDTSYVQLKRITGGSKKTVFIEHGGWPNEDDEWRSHRDLFNGTKETAKGHVRGAEKKSSFVEVLEIVPCEWKDKAEGPRSVVKKYGKGSLFFGTCLTGIFSIHLIVLMPYIS